MCHDISYTDLIDHGIRAGSFIIMVGMILFRERLIPARKVKVSE